MDLSGACGKNTPLFLFDFLKIFMIFIKMTHLCVQNGFVRRLRQELTSLFVRFIIFTCFICLFASVYIYFYLFFIFKCFICLFTSVFFCLSGLYTPHTTSLTVTTVTTVTEIFGILCFVRSRYPMSRYSTTLSKSRRRRQIYRNCSHDIIYHR